MFREVPGWQAEARRFRAKRPAPNSRDISRHFGPGEGSDAGTHVEVDAAVGAHVHPEQRCQRLQVTRGQPPASCSA